MHLNELKINKLGRNTKPFEECLHISMLPAVGKHVETCIKTKFVFLSISSIISSSIQIKYSTTPQLAGVTEFIGGKNGCNAKCHTMY